jgi:hypothetical protein
MREPETLEGRAALEIDVGVMRECLGIAREILGVARTQVEGARAILLEV